MPKKAPAKSNKLNRSLILVIAGVTILLISGAWLWWNKVYANPHNVFWGMVNNNFATHSVTRHITQGQSNNGLDQWLQLNLNGQNAVYAKTTVQQTTEQGENSVTTESVGLKNADYVRYQDIQTNQKTAEGKDLDLSQIVGVWSGQEISDNQQTGKFLKESLLGTFPMANLQPAERKTLVKFLMDKGVYDTDFSKALLTKEQGRKAYLYKVKLNPQLYAEALREYARVVGLGDLTELDPANYQQASALQLEITVDVTSRQLIKVNLVDSGRQEYYSGYGINYAISAPKDVVPVEELEKRLQNIR